MLEECRLSLESDRETWSRLRSVVENHLDVVDWVLRNSIKTEKKDSTIKKVLSLLVDHGVLFTLHSTTNIHNGDFREVDNLLTNYKESSATFRAYRSMLCALRAVRLSDSYSTRVGDVSEALSEMRDTLKDLFPLDIRLEAVENIFSMLFLRHEDFSEDEEGEEERKPETDYKKIRSGFICSKYIIRDLLHCLEAAVLDIGIEPNEQVGKRLANLSRAIADATWRLELLTSSEFVRNVGVEDNEEENFAEILLTKSKTARRNESIFYQQEESSSSDECLGKSEVDFSSDPGSADGSRKKSWKKNSAEKNSTNINYSFILNFMLSSKESLIIQCLWKCDFDKAQQVVKVIIHRFLIAVSNFSKA